VELTYRLEIRGPLPRVVQEELRQRFGDAQVRFDGDRTVVSGLTADQAALRAVLSLLWDLGSEVRLVEAITLPGNGEEGVQS
jgi:nicotinamidase-related amidase